MENIALQIVSRFLTAVQKGDNEILGSLLHPDIQWSQPGSNRFSGMKKSITEAFQMVGGMYEVSGNTLALTDIKEVAINGNDVACLVHWKAVANGKELDVDNIDVYTVEGGKIVKAVVFSADIEIEDSFWGK